MKIRIPSKPKPTTDNKLNIKPETLVYIRQQIFAS